MIEVKEEMKACEHYKMFGRETWIEQSELPWNGWVYCYEKGQLYYSTFRTGIFLEYLQHLLESKKCRREIGVTKRKVQRMLRKIEKEWERTVI